MTTSNQFFSPLAITGTLISVQGAHIVARLPQGSVGDLCWIRTRNRGEIRGQILSFHENDFSLALFDEPEGIFPGAQVRAFGSQLTIPVSMSLLGQVVSPLCIPLNDPSHLVTCCEMRPLFTSPPLATTRPLITEPLITGIRSIDGFCRLGRGQRIAICAPAGVGKSTLLGQIAR